MAFFLFKEEDVITINISTFPSFTTQRNGDQVTGSVFLERTYLESSLQNRLFKGFSAREGGQQEKISPFTASVDIVDAELGATNRELYQSILILYDFYSILNADYTPDFTGSETTRFRVITIPEIYYDRQILTGSFSASDLDSAGASRDLFDNGRGSIYSGSLTGTLVGNVFYNEGLVVLKGGGLNDESAGNDFGEVSPTNFKWKVSLKGTHKIPVNIFKCRAPSGQLNATTNPTYVHILTGSSDDFRNEKRIVLDTPATYVTKVGLFNEDFELVGVASLAQPVKKNENQDVLFRLRLDR